MSGNGGPGAARIVARRVISLPDSPRRTAFEGNGAASTFTFFDAFDARRGGGEQLFDVEAYAREEGRAPLGGEIGCAISHYLVMREFAEGSGAADDLMLVAEDDVVFSTHLEPVLHKVASLMRAGDLALLADPYGEMDVRDRRKRSERDVQLSLLARPVGGRHPAHFLFGHYEGEPAGAMLYAVSRRAAALYCAFVAQQGRIQWAADDYRRWALPAGIDVRVLKPNLVSCRGPSEIGVTDDRHTPVLTGPPGRAPGDEEDFLQSIKSFIGLRTRGLIYRGMVRATISDVRRRLASRRYWKAL